MNKMIVFYNGKHFVIMRLSSFLLNSLLKKEFPHSFFAGTAYFFLFPILLDKLTYIKYYIIIIIKMTAEFHSGIIELEEAILPTI